MHEQQTTKYNYMCAERVLSNFCLYCPTKALQSQIKQKFKINVGEAISHFVFICTDALVSTSNKTAGG